LTGPTLAEAAAQAEALVAAGDEQALATLRLEWDDELEMSARSQDFRERALAYRAIAQFRFRQKIELLRRGLEDDSPACRGSALVALETLSRDHPGVVNQVRPRLHSLADADGNQAVRRLAIVCLKNASPQPDTIRLLKGLADDDEQDRELRDIARKVAELLRKKSGAAR
jgi:HEAT repeat protein